ncbi:MAG: glutamate synthase subunit beta [Candidatus Omnitrophica bacterium]|nr:glutamate synthase subunit beta [Candidatus Omnitrophota bacterium]
MVKPEYFLETKRLKSRHRPVKARVKDYCEVALPRPEESLKEQARRCMDCGTSFCNWGCPLGNYIPEWNCAVSNGKFPKAAVLLNTTNNLAEVTGRICPAPCEYSCVLGINDEAVTIRENELEIIENAFSRGLVKPMPPLRRSANKIAVIGSGPAGWAAADELNKFGHQVVVFEKDDKPGGIMRYGIPDFKLNKSILDRRLDILKKEGVEFVTNTEAGKALGFSKIKKEFDAICLAGGSRVPRDLRIEGRDLLGIHFAMDYLVQANKRVAGENFAQGESIDAKGKDVVVIGGGDTGSDCVGTAHRQRAKSVTQIELLPKPPACRSAHSPWPKYPILFKTTSSHEEGGQRKWSIMTKKFVGSGGKVIKLSCVKVDACCKEVAGSGFEIKADLVILALGFLHPEKKGPIQELGLEFDQKGNVKTKADFMSSKKGIFCCGDMRRGQSLVVWAIAEGRKAASCIDTYLR